jgi:hypothetical protein
MNTVEDLLLLFLNKIFLLADLNICLLLLAIAFNKRIRQTIGNSFFAYWYLLRLQAMIFLSESINVFCAVRLISNTTINPNKITPSTSFKLTKFYRKK